MDPKPDVRELLKQCCATRDGCCRAGRHCCDETEDAAPSPVTTAGDTEPRGPLAAEVQASISSITHRHLSSGHQVRILLNGDHAYQAMLELIEGAEHQILLDNFAFLGDAVGQAFAQALARRASEGVRVRVLVDALGSTLRRRPTPTRLLQSSPATLTVFNPPRLSPSFMRRGRDHRKLLVQDRHRAVVGGLCIADVWLGNCINHCTWRDTSVLVAGDAAAELAVELDSSSQYDEGFRLPSTSEARTKPEHPLHAGVGVPVRVIPDGPGRRVVEQVLTTILPSAEHEILVTTPYFVPTAPIAEALANAARRGVRVAALVPATSDHPIVDAISERILGALLLAGVRVWRWQGPMIHAKTMVVDRRWSMVGSSNVDALSLRRNHELNVAIHGSRFGEQLGAVFDRDRQHSTEVTCRRWQDRPLSRRVTGALAAPLRGWV